MASWDTIPATTIVRAYVGRHQISLVILNNDSGNDSLHSKCGLHFNIRKRYLPLGDNTEVVWITFGDEEEVLVQTQILAGLKFKPPDVSEWETNDFLIGTRDGDTFK